MTVPELQTERLLMRGWRAEDFDLFADFYADQEMARFVGGVSTREAAWRRLAAIIGHWSLQGCGYWAVEERSTGELAGCVGLWCSEAWPELELGYWIRREKQGKGYAVEAGAPARDHAFRALNSETLVSYIHPDNEPSKTVATRLGAIYESTIELLDFGPHCVYRYPSGAPA